MADIVNPDVERYMRALQDRHDEPVLLEMEREAAERDFPIINRLCGVAVEVLARSVRARRVFELGSGYGYSAYWFARAAGDGGEVHCTDTDADNARTAEGYLGRVGLWDRIRFHVGDAVTELGKVSGEFDVVYNDINKDGYPVAWRAARKRVRVGGLYICDNVLWSGRVAEKRPRRSDPRSDWTAAIVEHNRLIADDRDYLSTIVPLRDGLMVALRLR
jgi:predicted O-methyltransferase YrrM